MSVFWETYRRPNNTLDLVEAWRIECNGASDDLGAQLLRELEQLQPINSRQLAALALVLAGQVMQNANTHEVLRELSINAFNAR